MFHVGQLVVCVDDEWTRETAVWPTKGQVYTIRRVTTMCGPLALLLEEISDDAGSPFQLVLWGARRFRPLTERNIEIIESLLQPLPEKEMA